MVQWSSLESFSKYYKDVLLSMLRGIDFILRWYVFEFEKNYGVSY